MKFLQYTIFVVIFLLGSTRAIEGVGHYDAIKSDAKYYGCLSVATGLSFAAVYVGANCDGGLHRASYLTKASVFSFLGLTTVLVPSALHFVMKWLPKSLTSGSDLAFKHRPAAFGLSVGAAGAALLARQGMICSSN